MRGGERKRRGVLRDGRHRINGGLGADMIRGRGRDASSGSSLGKWWWWHLLTIEHRERIRFGQNEVSSFEGVDIVCLLDVSENIHMWV